MDPDGETIRAMVGIQYDWLDNPSEPELVHAHAILPVDSHLQRSLSVDDSMAASVTKSLQQLAHSKGVPLSGLQPEDDKDVLFTTGPMRWSQEVFPYLSSTSDTEVTHRNFTGLKEPRVFRGVMILPINAFASDLGHSGSRISVTNETLVWHSFQGAWKSEEKVSEDKETGSTLYIENG